LAVANSSSERILDRPCVGCSRTKAVPGHIEA
jgi:hypothetical protein